MCDADLMCIKAQPYRYGFYMHAANDYATRLHACLPKFVCVLVFIPVHLWFDCMRFFKKSKYEQKKIRGFKVNCVSVCVM